MSLFGEFYSNPLRYKKSKKEQIVAGSEDWSAAILSGSSDLVVRQNPVKKYVYIILFALVIFSSLVLFWRLFSLQIAQGQKNSLLAAGNSVRTTVVQAPRGAIYDRNGVLLARNSARFDLVVIPSQLPESEESLKDISNRLSTILSKSPDEIYAKIVSITESDLPEDVLESDIDRDKALSIEEKSRELQGIVIENTPKREYLDEGMLAHFMGYIGRISKEEWEANPEYRQVDLIGKSGIEKSYESELRGIPGKDQVEVDSTGKPVRFLSRIEPKAGRDLYLTIDWELQKQMYKAVKDQVEKSGAKAGSGAAVNPQTGEVLAAVNYPTFDTNLFANGISQSKYDELLNNDSKPLLNRVTSGNYPIGSVVKPFISAAALEEKVINSSTTIVDNGKIDVPNIYNPSIVYTFKGWKPEGFGGVDVVKALQWSSDIFYYQVGGGYQSFRGLGEKRLLDWYEKFGFGSKTGLDIAEESAGFLPSPESKLKSTKENWYVGDTYNISIGQGDMKATPLQVLVANSAVANGGKIIAPKIFMKSSENGNVVRSDPVKVVRDNLVSDSNLDLIKRGLDSVVSSGTACCEIKSEVGVQVSGKTGTAETSSEGFDKKNLRTKPHAWFTAYAPSTNPVISSVIMIENSGEGSQFAAPATKEVLKWYFQNRKF